MRSLPNRKVLRKLFDYDAETGALYWRARGLKKWDSRYAGTEAGTRTHKGYIQIAIYGKLFFAHRIAYAWMADKQPVQIDHVDGDGFNNRWSNLRAATVSQNQINRRKLRGAQIFRGVYKARKKFVAQIKTNQVHTYIGSFDTAEEAAVAYDKEAKRQHGKFALTNKLLGLL